MIDNAAREVQCLFRGLRCGLLFSLCLWVWLIVVLA